MLQVLAEAMILVAALALKIVQELSTEGVFELAPLKLPKAGNEQMLESWQG